ncbi:MAG: response regulator [Planctomycetota bacterium]|nr:response regulator [Planctomycetota bacterium]
MSSSDVPPASPVASTEAAIDAQIDLSQASILVVDDHEQNLELLQAYLEEVGCRVRTAADGVQALAEVDAEAPDLVILDVMMPRMSGFQVCRHVKADPLTRDIPVVMVTALSDVGDVERAVECGADDFLTKPVHKLELVTRAKSLLRYRLLKKQFDKLARERSGGRGPAGE